MISGRILDDNTSQNESFYYSYPHSNALLQFRLELERCKPHKASHHPKKCDVINDLKQLKTVCMLQYILAQVFQSSKQLKARSGPTFWLQIVCKDYQQMTNVTTGQSLLTREGNVRLTLKSAISKCTSELKRKEDTHTHTKFETDTNMWHL